MSCTKITWDAVVLCLLGGPFLSSTATYTKHDLLGYANQGFVKID